VKLELEQLKTKYPGDENKSVREEIDAKIAEYEKKAAAIDLLKIVTGIFDDF